MKWNEAPAGVRDAVAAHLGPVSLVQDITIGDSSDLAAVVAAGEGRAFIKGVRAVSFQMRWLRNEIIGNSVAGALAPAVLFHVDLDPEDAGDGEDWLIVGFEFVDGRPLSFAPGSADLDVVGAMVERIAAIVPNAPELRSLARRW